VNGTALVKSIETVTRRWCQQRKREEREFSARASRWDAMTRTRTVSLKEAAWDVMETAYLKASSNGTLPAHARQIMYAARGEILRLTKREQLNDAYFTQVLLPDYIEQHPEAQEWDIVYDARGHFAEPHASADPVSLGTIQVREYLGRIQSHYLRPVQAFVSGGERFPTCGPQNRYSAVLFIEKEGFLPLFDRVKLAEHFDLAIMSTKGVSNVASRTLIDSLCGPYNIPLLVLHDFDADGFKILGTLSADTRRYAFKHSIQAIDLGLRLDDVEKCKLESEVVAHSRNVENMLTEYGATDKEMEFLASRRVELNAFGSRELVDWIEGKLRQHGIRKIVPDTQTQAQAYGRAMEALRLEQAIAHVAAHARRNKTEVPRDLNRKVRALLQGDPSMAWDEAIATLAREAGMNQSEGD